MFFRIDYIKFHYKKINIITMNNVHSLQIKSIILNNNF